MVSLNNLIDWLRVEHRLFLRPRAVISFPKSGRTWLRTMLDEIGIPVRYTHAGSRFPSPLLTEVDWVEHLRFRRVLVLVRDPRDTVVSFWYAGTRRSAHPDRWPNELSDFIRKDTCGIEKIALFNLHWAAHAAQAQHMRLLTYEQMRADPVAGLGAVAAFLGRPQSPDVVARIVDNHTIDKMRAREASGEYARRFGKRLRPGDPGDPESYKVRRGRVGGYADEMTADDIAYCGALLQRLGYAEKMAAYLAKAGVLPHEPSDPYHCHPATRAISERIES